MVIFIIIIVFVAVVTIVDVVVITTITTTNDLYRYNVRDARLQCMLLKAVKNQKKNLVWELLLLVGCLTSQQHASVSQGRICSDNFTCCHTEIEVAFHLTQSQYTDTGPTSPNADPITPGAWQGSHWSANFEVTGMTRPRKNPGESGIRTRDLPLSRETPYHWANEAVGLGDSMPFDVDVYNKQQCLFH